MMTADIHDYVGRRVHMIGIGGSSMSGLAGLLKDKGYIVTGSDKTRSHKVEHLEEKGIQVKIGHAPENVHGADLVIYSAAINDANPERAELKRLGIPEIERCELLGQLMSDSRNAVCVSGTHGKTTTTAMIAQSFMAAGANPNIHIGGELDIIGGSTRFTDKHNDFIIESCEYNRSFLKFKPHTAVITNIDEDHLDCYGDIEHIEEAFRQFAALLPEDGLCVAWGDDERARRVCESAKCAHITYGVGEGNDLRPLNLKYDSMGFAEYDAVLSGRMLGHFRIGVASEPNMLDSLACIAVCAGRGLDMEKVANALQSFKGAHRRFELTSITDGVRCYTDYGHNPAEIKTALEIADMQPHHELWCVFQPHTYSRTKFLFDQFLETFDLPDHLLITDICAAREVDPGDINSGMFIEPLKKRGVDVHLTPTFDDVETYLRANWHDGDIMISHGCGDIDLLNEQISLHGDTRQ